MSTTIFEKEYHGLEELHELKMGVMEMWNVRRNPMMKNVPEELLEKKFRGTIRVMMTYSEEEKEGIKVGDQVKMVGHDSPLLIVKGKGENFYFCKFYINNKKHTGWFHKDSIMVH